MYYKKTCPICLKQYFASKINTLYCSKKCNNRSRSIPDPLLKNLIKSVSIYTMDVKEYQRSIMINPLDIANDTQRYIPTIDNALGKDADYLIALAKMEAEQRKRDKEIEEQKKEQSANGFGFVTTQETNGDQNVLFNGNNDSVDSNSGVIDKGTQESRGTRGYAIRRFNK